MRQWFGWLTEHLWLKLVSLLLAIGFWFYVVGEESIEITKMVALEVKPPTEKLRVVKSSTRLLTVTFQSPRHMVSALSSGAVSAMHQIAGVEKPGEYSFTVSPDDILLSYPQVRIVKFFPSVVTATLDEIIVKKLAIEVDLVGEPAYGYRVDRETIELDPNAVLVEGPRAILEKMNKIETEPLQLVGRVRSFRRTVRIHQASDTSIIGDAVTDVQIPIKAEFAKKEFRDVVVKPLGSAGSDYYVFLEKKSVSLVFKGPQALLEQFSEDAILAYVDVESLKEGSHELPVKLILPPDLVLEGDPPKVPALVKKLKS